MAVDQAPAPATTSALLLRMVGARPERSVPQEIAPGDHSQRDSNSRRRWRLTKCWRGLNTKLRRRRFGRGRSDGFFELGHQRRDRRVIAENVADRGEYIEDDLVARAWRGRLGR